MRPFSNTVTLNVYYRLPVLALCTLIFWQSSFPSVISHSFFAHQDKVLHFGAYALLAGLVARNLIFEKQSWSRGKIKFMAILFVATYGLSDEIHQAFVPFRCASAFDFMADLAGSVAGCLIFLEFLSPLQKSTRP